MKPDNEQISDHKLNSNYQVLGIGTSIVDYFFNVSFPEIEAISKIRGGSILIEHQALEKILKDHPPILGPIAGGSAANTIKGLAKLGHSCALIGKIGRDDTGKKFTESLERDGITPLLSLSNLPTAQAACLITPDHERTIQTYIGAGAEMNESDFTPELFKGVQLVHIEGYLMNRKGVVEKAMELAKQSGAKISFDLSSFEIALEYKKSMIELLANFVDIVFANEDETKALTGLPPEKGCLLLKDLCEIAIVKMGSKGSWAAAGPKKAFYKAFPVNVVDTTGAGDLYASGFLHGFLTNKNLEENMQYGTLIASQVVQTLGGEISPESWKDINTQLKKNS